MQIYQEYLPISLEQLSNPAFETKLPFPFVFDTLPKRFKFESSVPNRPGRPGQGE